MAAAAEQQRRSEWPLGICVLAGLAGLIILTFYNWRNGILIFSGSVLLAGLLRLMLNDDQAGLLHVRGRMFDAALLLAAGAAILVLALVIPNG
jgi:predicted neutral ceramidase superfamily lipid hydrolase